MATFVLKLAAHPTGDLCGTITRVTNGETRPFAGSGDLISSLVEWNALESARRANPSGPRNARSTTYPDRPATPDPAERKRP